LNIARILAAQTLAAQPRGGSMATKRAEVISITDLSKSIDRAVAIASKRHGIKTDANSLVLNWEILGRILRQFEDLNAADRFATEVTKAVTLKGIQADPAIVKIGRDILCGFIERGKLPRQLPRG
jgi:hypothetical protein